MNGRGASREGAQHDDRRAVAPGKEGQGKEKDPVTMEKPGAEKNKNMIWGNGDRLVGSREVPKQGGTGATEGLITQEKCGGEIVLRLPLAL